MKKHNTEMQTKNDRAGVPERHARHALCIVLPLWLILDGSLISAIYTLATALVWDGALLVALLLILRPRRSGGRMPDAGNIWRHTVIPVFLADILSTLAGAGFYLLCLHIIPAIFGTDAQYLLDTAAVSPMGDLFTLIPALTAVAVNGGVMYLVCRRLIFGDRYRYQNAAAVSLLLALCTAPYSLLFPQILSRLA